MAWPLKTMDTRGADMKSSPAANDPIHLARRDQQPRWTNPRADEPGFGRAFVPGLAGVNCAANMIVLPFGQGCPRHDFGGEVIIHVLEGEIEYVVDGQTIVLEPQDYLYIPPRTFYSYRNVAPGVSRMLSIIGRVDEWPASSSFEGVDGKVVTH